MIVLVELDRADAADEIRSVQLKLEDRLTLIWLLTSCGFFAVLCLILYIVLLMAKRIQRAIIYMKDKTNDLKKANDVQSKRDIIKKISSDVLFKKISETYTKMKQAQQALLLRHLRIEAKKESNLIHRAS